MRGMGTVRKQEEMRRDSLRSRRENSSDRMCQSLRTAVQHTEGTGIYGDGIDKGMVDHCFRSGLAKWLQENSSCLNLVSMR